MPPKKKTPAADAASLPEYQYEDNLSVMVKTKPSVTILIGAIILEHWYATKKLLINSTNIVRYVSNRTLSKGDGS